MKFDMHCHVKEGSIDSKVALCEYIRQLKDRGFSGMLVTDHDSYDGFRKWKYELKYDDLFSGFDVIKGIEYDTRDAGHMIIVMPDNLKLRILEVRGLPIEVLIDVIHKHGGIIGPAHPCGEKYLSIMNTGRFRKDDSIMEKFDFVEAFNACEGSISNERARALAEKYGKVQFGGSDSHKTGCIGTAYTELEVPVHTAADLIKAVKERRIAGCGGTLYRHTSRQKLGRLYSIPIHTFYFFNKSVCLVKWKKRRRLSHQET